MEERVNLIATRNTAWSVVQCFGLVLAALLPVSPRLKAQEAVPLTPEQALETPQHANERIRTLTMGAKNVPHDYVIGSGDLISITVFDVPELSRDVRVSQSGSISMPLVPVRLGVS